MIETVIALLMIVDHEIKEHRIQVSMSECLRGKRVAERQLKSGGKISYKCIKSKAKTEIYMGEKSIKALILD
tara:strand:- start:416 stop:631 length:216 start_codon:yes stop_codon:yes gene_type:complete